VIWLVGPLFAAEHDHRQEHPTIAITTYRIPGVAVA
jgi:hypothetical protein